MLDKVRTMTCELRCLRAWAELMREKPKKKGAATAAPAASGAAGSAGALGSAGQGRDLFQELRALLMQRFLRADVATWFRALLVRATPKPIVAPDHEDGTYLVCDERLGWVTRLETSFAPCSCDSCMALSTGLPASSAHFSLPEVESI